MRNKNINPVRKLTQSIKTRVRKIWHNPLSCPVRASSNGARQDIFSNGINFIIALLFFLIIFPLPSQAAPADLIITEIMYNPAGSDTDAEWIEIYNDGAEPVEIITGSGAGSWRFNDGTNHTFTLARGSATLPTQGVAVLASNAEFFLLKYPQYSGALFDTVMSLNNTSDTLKLSADKGESFFGEVTYQNSWGGDGDGKSLEKVNLGGSNEAGNWRPSTNDGGTPGAVSTSPPPEVEPVPEPSVSPPPSSPVTAPSPTIDPTKIKFSEVYPNPKEGEEEFIEIWNSGGLAISLAGWKLADEAKVITLSDLTLVPGEYKPLFYNQTKVALNNGSEAVRLFDGEGSLISEIKYSATTKGQSFAWSVMENKFIWTTAITPGAANEILLPNDPPLAVISITPNPAAPLEKVIFSAEESSDPDDDKLDYFWTIKPSPQAGCGFCREKIFQANGSKFTYTFSTLGNYLVTLEINDEQHRAQATGTAEILPPEEIISRRLRNTTPYPLLPPSSELRRAGKEEGVTDVTPATNYAYNIYLNEIFPNPAGNDESEWIEIFNSGPQAVNLAGWSLDDGEGGSKPYKFPETFVEPKSYLIVKREDSKIILNNASDSGRLFDAAGNLADSADYEKVIEGQTLARDSDEEWSWTPLPTPGAANEFVSSAPLYSSYPSYSSYPAISPTEQDYIDIDLEDLRELELGTRVRVQGKVAVEPGLLGKTYFYLAGSPGAQIYFSKQDWPALKLGDVVGVLGEISEAGGETRIKIAKKEDLVWLYKGTPPEPIAAATGQVTESLEGALVKIAGEIIQKNGNTWLVDDGSGEVRVVFQEAAKIEKPAAGSGDWIAAVGLVSETRSGYRVLPRYTADLQKTEPPANAGEVLGASKANNFTRFSLPANDYSGKVLRYLLATAAAFSIIAIILFFRLRRHYKKALATAAKTLEGEPRKDD